MAEGIDNGISGGNDREDRIAKFLREAPPRATMLVLTPDPPTNGVLAGYQREQWNDQLAALIDAEMVAQHDVADVVDSSYWLIFTGDNPNDIAATRRRKFSVRTRKALTAIGEDGLPKLALDGSAATQATLNQTILFKMVSLYSTNMQALLNAQTTTITKLTELHVKSKDEETQARDDLHELKELIVQLKMAEQEQGSEMTEAQRQWFELAQKATQSPELQRLVEGVSRMLLAKFAG